MLKKLSGWWHLRRFKYWFSRGIAVCQEYDLLYNSGTFAPDLVKEQEYCRRKAHHHHKRCLVRDVEKLNTWINENRGC